MEELPGVSGYSAATIIVRSVGKPGFYVLWSLICFTAFAVVSTALQANARTFFAFSRDEGLPDKGLFQRLAPNKVPMYAVWLVCFICGASFCSIHEQDEPLTLFLLLPMNSLPRVPVVREQRRRQRRLLALRVRPSLSFSLSLSLLLVARWRTDLFTLARSLAASPSTRRTPSRSRASSSSATTPRSTSSPARSSSPASSAPSSPPSPSPGPPSR